MSVAVAAYITLGFVLHLGGYAYLLLGVPFTLVFPLVLQRRPIRELWVRGTPAPRIDATVLVIFLALAIYPVILLVQAVGVLIARARNSGSLDWAFCGYLLLMVVGAFGAAWSLRALGRDGWRRVLRCVTVAGGTGALLVLYQVLVCSDQPFPTPWHAMLIFARTALLYVPVVFVLEEVFFRGALDSYLHRPGEPKDGWSAVGLSILWGVWHLPVQSLHMGVARTVIGLLPLQVLVGVTLSLWWRRSGNLAVPGLAHAFLDAFRDMLVYGH